MRLTIEESLVGVVGLTWLAELGHTDLEIVQGTFNEAVAFFKVKKQVVPQGMLEMQMQC
jgi:hypothetical protein